MSDFCFLFLNSFFKKQSQILIRLTGKNVARKNRVLQRGQFGLCGKVAPLSWFVDARSRSHISFHAFSPLFAQCWSSALRKVSLKSTKALFRILFTPLCATFFICSMYQIVSVTERVIPQYKQSSLKFLALFRILHFLRGPIPLFLRGFPMRIFRFTQSSKLASL